MRYLLDTNILSDLIKNPAGNAAHALALESTLVTDNLREFSRIPGLLLENWLRD